MVDAGVRVRALRLPGFIFGIRFLTLTGMHPQFPITSIFVSLASTRDAIGFLSRSCTAREESPRSPRGSPAGETLLLTIYVSYKSINAARPQVDC